MRSLLRRVSSTLTIRQQIGVVFSLGIFILATIAAIFIAQAAEKRIEGRLIRQGNSLAAALAATASLPPAADDPYSQALPMLTLPFVEGIAIYSAAGTPLFHSGAPIPAPQDSQSQLDNDTHWYFFAAVDNGQGHAAVALEKAALSMNSAGILQSNLVASLVSAAVMLVLILLVTGRIVGPLQSLSSAMNRARRGEANVRAELSGSKELLAMGEAFNTMIHELEARQEQLLRARDAALASSRIKGEFASTLSHELRTPMNGIMGMLDLLRTTSLSDEQEEYLSIARNSGKELLRLIEESLEMARTGAVKQELNIAEFGPRALVEEVYKLLEHKAHQKNLTLSWEVDAGVPDILHGDAGRIRQILINLVANAIKFTSAGQVHIHAGLDTAGEELCIAVTDTGEGIPAAARQRIFEPYVQLNDSPAPASNAGTGLGLFICTELVRAMGGSIGVDSEPGKGSRFWFRVPRSNSALPASTVQQTEQPVGTSQAPQILVVDDDSTSRMLMSAILKKDGYQVAEAEDGTEALEYCRQQLPDLILMDALMPIMDGFTACQEIIRAHGQSAPQILMITALQDDDTLERALSSGATDFVSKPINATVLRQRVLRMLHTQKVDHHLHQLSNFDQLTGLPNRAVFVEEAHRLLAEAEKENGQVALLFIDLDRFKVINETRGHEVGDALLQCFGERLKTAMRQRDVISRLSGDIFTVLLDKVRDAEGAIAAANKVLELARQPFNSTSQPVYLSASIGISMYPQNGNSMAELMRQADAAMYRAKSRGGNTFEFYQTGMELVISQEIELEIGLRDALEQNQFVLHYQPQVALPQGQLIGLEALVRWQHPRRGLLPPAEFIPLAEKTGLIAQIDEWVMKEACYQLRRWIDAGLTPVPIAVNVSGGELADNLLITQVKECLEETRIPARLLKLEITEDTLASSSADTTALLQELRTLGVTLAIDDFGTGYSSLSYLKLFPVDTLKIDRSFISDLPYDSSSAAIVSGIITLGHNLKLTIIAEGAETAAQRQFLEQANCDVMQGFLVSRPLPAAEIEKWLVKAMRATGAARAVESI